MSALLEDTTTTTARYTRPVAQAGVRWRRVWRPFLTIIRAGNDGFDYANGRTSTERLNPTLSAGFQLVKMPMHDSLTNCQPICDEPLKLSTSPSWPGVCLG